MFFCLSSRLVPFRFFLSFFSFVSDSLICSFFQFFEFVLSFFVVFESFLQFFSVCRICFEFLRGRETERGLFLDPLKMGGSSHSLKITVGRRCTCLSS